MSSLPVTQTEYSPKELKFIKSLLLHSKSHTLALLLKSQNRSYRKEEFIRKNFHILNINEQVYFNDCKTHLTNWKEYAKGVGFGVAISLFLTAAIVLPTTRSLIREGYASIAIGGFVGWMSYKYKVIEYNEKITELYYKCTGQ